MIWKQFTHLGNFPPELKARFNSFLTTEFDDSLSVEMQLRSIIKWCQENFKTVDTLIDFINDISNWLKQFEINFDTKLEDSVISVLSEWQVSGQLDVVISEALQWEFDSFKAETEQNFLLANQQLQQTEQELTEQLQQTVKVVNVENFEGTDTQKIQQAMNVASGRILKLEDNKTYLIESEIIGVSGVTILGKNTTIKAINRINNILNFSNKSDIVIDGVIFDMNKQGMPIYQLSDYPNGYNTAIYMHTGKNLKIVNCEFLNLYTRSVTLTQCTGNFVINNNIFKSPTQTQTQIIDHLSFTTVTTGTITITDNYFNNVPYTNPASGVCAIFMAGVTAYTTIRDNQLIYCGRDNTGGHRLNPIDFYGNCRNINVINNTIKSVFGLCRMASCKDMRFEGNTVEFLKGHAESFFMLTSYQMYGLEQVLSNITITDNTFISQTEESIWLFQLQTTDWGLPPRGIYIDNNKFINKFNRILWVQAPIVNLTFNSNSVYTRRGGTPTQTVFHIQTPIDSRTEDFGVETASLVSGVEINNNDIIQSGTNEILLQTYVGTVKPIRFSDNNVELIGSNTFSLQIHTTPTLLLNNIISNAGTYGLYIRGDTQTYLMGNILENCTYNISAASLTGLKQANNFENGVEFIAQ